MFYKHKKKTQFLKDHVTSLNRHVMQLSEKKYEDIYKIDSPDFVLLFIPIEPAFAVAINAKPHHAQASPCNYHCPDEPPDLLVY